MWIRSNTHFTKFILIVFVLFGTWLNPYSQDVFLYEDKNALWDINDAVNSSEFIPINKMFIQSDITKSVFWIKISPKKSFASNEKILFSNSINHFKTIYFQTTDGEINYYTFGVNQVNQSATLLPSFSLNENIQNIYISISSDSFIFENFQITKEKEANKDITLFVITQTFYFVIVFLTFIYMAFAYFKTKRHVLKYYLTYLFSLLFMFFYLSNIGGYLIWGNLPFSSSYFESFGTTMMITTYVLLTLKIAQVKHISKKLFYFSTAILILSCSIVIFLWLFSNPTNLSKFANLYSPFGLLLILTSAVVGILNKNKNSYLLFIGIIAVFSSGVLKLSINWGLVNYSVFLDFLTYLGFIIEVFVFTYLVLKHVEKEVILTQEQRQKLEQNALEIAELQQKLAQLANETNEEQNNLGFNISPDINELLLTPLTNREMEVLLSLAKGGSYDDISERLFISKTTLKTHVTRIYTKLDAKNRIDAINEAIKLTAQLQ